MRTKVLSLISVFFVFCLMLCAIPLSDHAPVAQAAVSTWDGSVTTSFSGSGTAASPYIIDTAAKLAGVAQLTNNNTGWSGGKYFVLTADIDLNNRQWTPIGIQRQNGGSATYSENNAWFRGYFDGNGHVVKNVRVGTSTSNRASVKHVGLFGITGGASVILNLGVETAQYYINHYCDDERVGGFVGYSKGVIQGCYVRNVTINQNGVCVIGGFCGQQTSDSTSTIYKCYAYNVSLTQGSGRKGGFVGDGNGTVAFSFVNYYPFKSDDSDGSFIYAYGETSVTGTIVGNGTNTGYGPESFMSSSNNGGWPQLIWQSTGPLDYNATDGYIVDSAAKMRSLACFVNNGRAYSGAKIALKADIDLSAYDWAPIGIWQTNRTRAFSGTFNGNGYIISNMKIGTSSSRNTLYTYKGLFGYTENATINCVGITGAQIYGNGPTDYRCGALVGQAQGSGKIYQCFVKNSTVNMSGTGVSGVIVGDIRHNLTDCYTLNSTATGTRAGTVVGDMKSTLYNVYSGANCSSTTNSYTSENKGTPANCYHKASTSASAGYVSTFNGYANRTNYWKSAGAWITDIYNINGGYACLKWEPRFTITFNGNSGTVSASTISGRYQYTATTPTASRTGYTFKGYFQASSGGSSVIGQSAAYTFGTTVPSNTARTGTLYAQWTANTYAVTLNGNTATTAGTASVTATYDSAMPSATMPKKTGYTFQGYYDTSATTGGTQYYTAAGASARTWNKTAATTLYARWTANTNTAYKVNHYQMNVSGSGYALKETENKTGTSDATLTLANLKKTYTGFTYKEGKVGNTVVATTTVAPDGTRVIDLYYSRNQLDVTFTKNGTGYTNTTPAAKAYYAGSVSFTVTLSTGYTNSPNPAVTATNGTVAASKSGNTITYTVSNITAATAINVGAATINSYPVTFKAENGTVLKTETVNHGGSATPPAAQTKAPDDTNHYTFNGWSGYTNITAAKTITASFTATAHSFDTFVAYTQTPTCMAPGAATYKCTGCTKTTSKTAAVDPANHTGNNTTTQADVVPATCVAKGSYTEVVTCECGTVISRTPNKEIAIDPANHTGNNTTTQADVVPATCVAKGSYTEVVTCECGEVISRTPNKEIAIDPTNHTGNNTTTQADVVPATCVAKGSYTEVVTCECGEVISRTPNKEIAIDPANHTGNNIITQEDVIPATCAAKGSYTQVTACECGVELGRETIETPVAENAHSWGEWTETAPATCTASGSEIRVCANDASHTETREVEALGHNWSAWTVVTEATPEAAGLEKRVCARCGEEETNPIYWQTETDKQVQFVVSGDMHYVLYADGVEYSIYRDDTPAILWYSSRPLTFSVVLHPGWTGGYIVSANGKELKANADGTYTMPAGEGFTMVHCDPVAVTPSGSDGESHSGVCPFCGKVHPSNLWGRLVALIHTFFWFFKNLFKK